MTEVYFYHLENVPLHTVLPDLVGKGQQRKWRMAIELPDASRLQTWSEMLWAAEDVAFLAHGFGPDDDAAHHPLWLTTSADNPNNATVRFYVEGAMPGDVSGLARAVILFDGGDETAVGLARAEWKRRKAEGCSISYWKQENGKWVNKAN